MVRLTDRLDMTIAVDWDVKPQTKQINQENRYFFLFLHENICCGAHWQHLQKKAYNVYPQHNWAMAWQNQQNEDSLIRVFTVHSVGN